jgi:predicted SAM-dependent methyltransferase
MRAFERAFEAVGGAELLLRWQEAASFRRHRRSIAEGAAQKDLRLHLGCGPEILPGWINVDEQADGDVLMARLPAGLRRFPDESARLIYASHFLEHLDYPTLAAEFARQCCRILIPGGVLRVVVPGIQKIMEAYVCDDHGFFAVQATIHPERCSTKLEHLMYALQQDGEHKYGYDFETISKLLLEAGFREISESDCNASRFEELRVDYRVMQDDRGNYLSLYVDAVK